MKSIKILFASVLFSHSAFSGSGPDVDVAIIGGGLSGLATAHYLKKAKWNYRIFEITPRVGGRVRTVTYHLPGDVPTFVDSGMEEYWESNPAVEILKELKLPVTHDIAVSSIVLGGTLYKLGDETQEQYYARLFTAEERLALEAFKSSVAKDIRTLTDHQRSFSTSRPALPSALLELKNTSFKDWIEERKLPGKIAEWIRVSVECEVGTSWDRFSALDGLAEFHIFLGKGEESYRVVGGNEVFVKAFASSVGLSNIELNQRVTRVEAFRDKAGRDLVRVSVLDQQTHRSRTITARAVVSTIPLFRAPLEIQFVPALSEKKRAGMMSQTWGSYFKAHVFFPKSSTRFWTLPGLKPVSFLPVLSDSALGVVYDGNRDSKGKTKIISLLTIGSFAERFNMMPLDAVRKELTSAFESFWPGSAAAIQAMEFYRFHPRAIAGWPVGRSRFDELSDEIRRPENHVFFAGDFTETTHSDGAFISAQRVTRQILESVPRR